MRVFTALALCALAFLVACASSAQTLEDRVPDGHNELLYDDVVELQVPASNASFFGVSLGDSEQRVRDLHGEPSVVEDYAFGRVKNLEYSFGLAGNQTAVLFHTEQGVVTAVLVMQDAEQLLEHDTLLGESREAMYGDLGVPTLSKDLYRERVFFYDELGYEVYTAGRAVDRIYFTQPNRGLEPVGRSSEDSCEQVVTPAVRGDECVEFPNPCIVPDDWSVVDSCEDVNRPPEIIVG